MIHYIKFGKFYELMNLLMMHLDIRQLEQTIMLQILEVFSLFEVMIGSSSGH